MTSRKVDRRSVAHQLLIELLASVSPATPSKLDFGLPLNSLRHQFAFPVRWIETQDVLFSKRDAISRFVELGPAKVLAGMAKRTRDLKFAVQDQSISVERHFLASTQNTKELRYEYGSPLPQSKVSKEGSPEPVPVTTAPPVLKPIAPQVAAVATSTIADVPTSAKEIVHALVAHKLKKEIEQVPLSKSIKELSGGKSTLQNELIGDLGNEFSSMPDEAEDLSLTALGDTLEANHAGQLGKQSSALVARLMSSKMPAGFNLNSVRQHLSQTWCLGPSRQTSILLFAITTEPSARLPSVDAANDFFDALTTRYATFCGLMLQAQSAQSGVHNVSCDAIHPAVLEALTEQQHKLVAKQFTILGEYLKVDVSSHGKKRVELEALQKDLQDKSDFWCSEFSDEFASAIKPCLDVKKSRRFNSWWNLARQEILALYHDVENGRPRDCPYSLEVVLQRIANRADPSSLTMVKSLTQRPARHQASASIFSDISKRLNESVLSGVRRPPVIKFVPPMTGPQTRVLSDGSIQYEEVIRSGNRYPRSYLALLKSGTIHGAEQGIPYAHLKSHRSSKWSLDIDMTDHLFKSLDLALQCGISLSGKNILITGAGPGSIGSELVQGLLIGGARVIVTTSRAPSATSNFYQQLYEECGARGSELLVIPCNQGSARDCEALIDHIYSESGLRRNLDAIIPFAAISQTGTEIDSLDAKSELAHRLMLVNVLRLLGRIIRNKKDRNIKSRPTQVLLPLSPNHGTFGGDGLYSESKLGLESLLNRFHSESWSDELTLCGIVIGWTRGTGLMSQNDIVAEVIESHDILTFSPKEMALNILMLLTPDIVHMCENEPIMADFSGGLGRLDNCKSILSKARADIDLKVEIAKAVWNEDLRETSLLTGLSGAGRKQVVSAATKQRSTLQVAFPRLPDREKKLKPLQHLQGMIDQGSTVVIVGYSELGPWGSSRTRWEMESRGKLSQEGYIEMAWIMNLIKHFDGETKGGHYVGWIDVTTGEHVHDSEIGKRYGQYILEHSGIRLIDPTMFGGYDPDKKEYLQEVVVHEDLPEFDATHATAEAFKLRHGEKVTIRKLEGVDEYKVQIKAGAHILVPKALPFDRGLVAGQFPKGWNPAKYGIQEDVISQVDPVTLHTLCCVSEALYSAGIVNSLEIFKHIHLSELGNFIGSSMGGTTKTRHMYKDIYLDKNVQGDVIQETFLNTTAAWVNMLLLGSTGPIKTPVGACATGVESIDIGYDSIISGKTKMCLVGGYDNFQEDESYGFSTMKATVNAAEETAHGRLPMEMSRPTAETRAGFVESQGCGIQILCSAELALEMGLPVYGIIASSTMAADKISRSVPAPGQGVLSFARETPEAALSPLLNMDYRHEQMEKWISQTQHSSGTGTPLTVDSTDSSSGTQTPLTIDSTHSGSSDDILNCNFNISCYINAADASRVKAARRLWGNDFRSQDPNISPLRASLAVWGLTVDDIDVASLHATSTKANDKNEPEVINKQMTHLRRTPGIPLLAICQKSITGHPKAPAASWMLNGCLQVLDTGLVPGNSNADNVDEVLRKFEHLVFPTRSIQTREIKAFLLTSFGFGQKGGQIVGVAPKYLFASLSKAAFETYVDKVTNRKKLANRAYARAVLSNTVVKAQSNPPYQAHDESKVFLDPLSRVSGDSLDNLYFDTSNLRGNHNHQTRTRDIPNIEKKLLKDSNLELAADISKSWIEQVTRERCNPSVNVGIDVEDLDSFTSDSNPVFINRNYTEAEQTFAAQSSNPHSTFVSRWCAKEAVFKALGVASKGSGAALKDIEISSDGKGAPKVVLHGDALAAAQERGIQDLMLSLSYSDNNVIAVALAMHGSGVPTYQLKN